MPKKNNPGCQCCRCREVPRDDLVVDGWRFVAPPIPPLRVDMPSITLYYQADYFGPGIDGWLSDCIPFADRPINSVITATRYIRMLASIEPRAEKDWCLGWQYVLYTDGDGGVPPTDCSVCWGGQKVGPMDWGGSRLLCNENVAGVQPWSFVSRTTSPFSEIWNSGSEYIKIRE